MAPQTANGPQVVLGTGEHVPINRGLRSIQHRLLTYCVL